MKMRPVFLILLAVFLGGCASTGFPPQTVEETEKVPGNSRIEISLTPGSFGIEEVEFHVDAAKIPPEILKRAKEEMPGGQIEDCEVEYHGGAKYYEVSARVKRQDHEVMFTEDGRVYRWEIAVKTSSVPKNILEAAKGSIKGAYVKKAEQILDEDKNLLEYHFKMEKGGVKYKSVVTLDGRVIQVYRETIGEIEVPLR